jgi:hypothetical protein
MSSLPEDYIGPQSQDASLPKSPTRRMWKFNILRSMKETPEQDGTRGLASMVQEAQHNMSRSLSKQVKSEKKEGMQRRIMSSSGRMREMLDDSDGNACSTSVVQSIANETAETCSCGGDGGGTGTVSESGCRKEFLPTITSPKKLLTKEGRVPLTKSLTAHSNKSQQQQQLESLRMKEDSNATHEA